MSMKMMAYGLIKRHGTSAVFSSISEGTYNVETGSATNTPTNTNIETYKNHVRANQFRFPNLIDKEVAEFYILADSLTTKPKPKDIITIDSDIYTVDSVEEHLSDKLVILYTVIAVRS